MPSRHPSAARFLRDGLFESLPSFAVLEQRVAAMGDDSTKAVGDAFEVFVEAYLATQPLLQCVDCYPVGQVPLDDRRTLNLPNDTKGIDGIFRTRNGTVVPYQVKYRSRRPPLSFTEVSPFLAVTERATDRLLITNCDRLAPDITKRDHLRTLRGTDFDQLTPEDFAACLAWLSDQSFKQPRAVPRPDQALAVQKITDTLATQPRATVVMPCGTGKTLVQLWAAEALGAKRVLVLVPSLSLIQQTLTEWSRHTNWGQRFRHLCVCSDPTVTAGVEDPLITTQADLDFIVDTDPAVVRAFMAGTDDAVRVVFSTYQSAKVVAAGIDGTALDLGIFDEAHKTTGPQGGMFAFPLTDANLPIRQRAFFTATPRHYLRARDREGDFKVLSMDDESIYGPVAYEMSFAEAVAQGIICDYRVVVSVVDPEEVSQYAIRHGMTDVRGDLQATEWVASQIAIQHAIEDTHASKVITFHSRVSHAQIFASHSERGIGQYLPDFTLGHVNGQQSVADRRDTLSGFKDERKRLVTNARCLTEGVDLPAVDMVAFINPRRSKVDIVQAVGRAMRKPRDRQKRYGFIFIPVLLDRSDSRTLTEACERTEWADVVEVLSALRDSDARLVEIVADMQVAKGRGTAFDPRAFAERVRVLGPLVSIDVLKQHLASVVLGQLGATWDERYGQLRAVVDRGGDANVPVKSREHGRLGGWLDKQRQDWRKGVLPTQRVARLEALGVSWDPFDASWQVQYQALKAIKDAGDDANIRVDDPVNPQLGKWLFHQRSSNRKGALPHQRAELLTALGVIWDPLDAIWIEQYQTLKKLKAAGGSVNISEDNAETPGLGIWLGTQRSRKSRGRLRADRSAMLTELGVIWDPRDAVWLKKYQALKAIKDAGNDVNIPRDDPSNPQLGNWLHGRRRFKKMGMLRDEEATLLTELGVAWEPQNTKWQVKYEVLKAIKDSGGDVNVAARYRANPILASWLNEQRLARRAGRLSSERASLLTSLGVVWDRYGPAD